MKIGIRSLPGNEDLPLPRQMSSGASGFDLFAAVSEPIPLLPGKWELIPTGIALQMPEGFEAQIRPRSGLALKYGITVLNAPGTIDADYRGEVGVILLNLGNQDFIVKRGERVAQLVFHLVPQVELELKDQLDHTSRGSGGFGHTGR